MALPTSTRWIFANPGSDVLYQGTTLVGRSGLKRTGLQSVHENSNYGLSPAGSRICGHAMASQGLKAKMLMDLNGPT